MFYFVSTEVVTIIPTRNYGKTDVPFEDECVTTDKRFFCTDNKVGIDLIAVHLILNKLFSCPEIFILFLMNQCIILAS